MYTEALQKLVLFALTEGNALDVVVLDVRARTDITDVMIIATGNSPPHVRAIGNRVAEEARKHVVPIIGIEGQQIGDWMLVDLGDAVVHIMLSTVRQFYALEKLWVVGSERVETRLVEREAASR